MKLYTINATCERTEYSKAINKARHNKYPDMVSHILQGYGIDGFTIQTVMGYWQGVSEQSYIITVATDDEQIIDNIAESLRYMYNQDAVMVTYPDNTVKFIER